MLKQSTIQNIQNQSAISNTLTKFIITIVGICVFLVSYLESIGIVSHQNQKAIYLGWRCADFACSSK